MTVSGAGFAKPAVEKTLLWKYVCCTPSGVISGLPSLSRGSQRLGFTADANVSHSFFFCSEALQLVTIQWYAACSRIMCSQAKTAISKRMAGLLIGAGGSPHVWVLLPIRGSRPPSDLLTRTMRLAKSAGLCIE